MQREYPIAVTWLPFELHPEIPETGWDLPQEIRDGFGGASEYLRQQAEAGGLPMVTPEIIPNSRRALEASEYARSRGQYNDFHKVVFRLLYAEGRNIHDWAVLQAAAEEVGLDFEDLQAKTEAGTYTQQVRQYKYQAVSLGARGVPLFIFDNKYAVVGLQPYAAFQEVMDTLLEENGINKG